MGIDSAMKPNPENVRTILENLKKAVLNSHSSEVSVAMRNFKKFLEYPEYWTSNWKEK